MKDMENHSPLCRHVSGLGAVFNPGSVAVVGASSGFGKWGQMILTDIVAGEYPGRIYPVKQAGALLPLTRGP